MNAILKNQTSKQDSSLILLKTISNVSRSGSAESFSSMEPSERLLWEECCRNRIFEQFHSANFQGLSFVTVPALFLYSTGVGKPSVSDFEGRRKRHDSRTTKEHWSVF